MKKSLLSIFCIALLSLLISCSSNETSNINEAANDTTNQNITDNSATKPHTLQLYNDIFSIKLDDSFNNLYDTVVESNYIEIYDLESRNNGFEGLAFAICAFDKPEDWAGSPSEKVGELELNDGKLYDIIIGYPTETQFGFDRDMPDNYKKLYDARYDIAKTVEGKNGEKISYDSGVKGDNLYDEVLDKLKKGLIDDWDANRFESENMSPMYASIKVSNDEYLNTILYSYYDVNLDGIEELLIGEKYDDRFVIYDLYTMVDRKPTHVLSGWDRNRYYPVSGSFISNEYSNSAMESGLNVYALETNSTNLIFQLALKYDSSVDENEPWFISYVDNASDSDWDKISEDQYNEMWSRFDKTDDIPYKAIKEY